MSQSIPATIHSALKQNTHLSENLHHMALSSFLLSHTPFFNSSLIVYMCQVTPYFSWPYFRNLHNLQFKNVSSSYPRYVPSKKMELFLTFKRYPSEQCNYSGDTTSLYEMWYTVLRATPEKLIIVAIMCLFQFTQLCDWQKLPKQNSIKHNFDSHKTSLPLL